MHEVEIGLLLRLLLKRECRESSRAQPFLKRFRTAGWIATGTRAGIWELKEASTPAIQARLGNLLPTWHDDVLLLRDRGLDPCDPANLRSLGALRSLPRVQTAFIHRKVWNAASAAGSKVASRIPSDAKLTDDWSQRGRVNGHTLLHFDEGDIDLGELTRLNGEFAISERGWLKARGLTGELPSVLVTVENVGPFVDLVLPHGAMLLFSQGAAVEGSAALLAFLKGAQWIHFGDLDPAGIACGARLARLAGREPRLYVPTFAHEYIARSLEARAKWTSDCGSHPVIVELAKRNRWLEQEFFMLDERLADDLWRSARDELN